MPLNTEGLRTTLKTKIKEAFDAPIDEKSDSNKIKQDYNVSIGIATVYRAMKFFSDLKLVNQLDIGDGIVRYELNISEHHDHLICTSCGKIIEFTDDFIELNQIKIAEKNNFILKEHVMTIYGLCENCQ